MGFHKRYITKDIILSNILKLDVLLSSEILIMDDWSSRFVKDLDPLERKIRKKVIEEQISGCPDKHQNYSNLKSLSESLISLKTNPSWLDVHFVQDKLGRFDLEIDEFGDLKKVSKKAIDKIIDYYSNKQ